MNGINRPLIKPQRRLVSVANLNIRHCIYHIHIECREWVPLYGYTVATKRVMLVTRMLVPSPSQNGKHSLHLSSCSCSLFFFASFYFYKPFAFLIFFPDTLNYQNTNQLFDIRVSLLSGWNPGAAPFRKKIMLGRLFFRCDPCFLLQMFLYFPLFMNNLTLVTKKKKEINPLARQLSTAIHVLQGDFGETYPATPPYQSADPTLQAFGPWTTGAKGLGKSRVGLQSP